MSRTNLRRIAAAAVKATQDQTAATYEGAPAVQFAALDELRRAVFSCMLWENEFYESGDERAARKTELLAAIDKQIAAGIPNIGPSYVAEIAVQARSAYNLRHVPLFIVREMCRYPSMRPYVEETLYEVIQRPDEISEFLALYWRDGRIPIANSVKRGLRRAFGKFDAYQLQKWQGTGRAITLRDVAFLVHAKPADADETHYAIVPAIEKPGETPDAPPRYRRGPVRRHWQGQGELLGALVKGTLPQAGTWEQLLSAGTDPKEAWTSLLETNRLPALALLRNLRNMQEAGVDFELIRLSIARMKADRVMPFRFIAAARFAPHLESELADALARKMAGERRLKGVTRLLVDVSGSMSAKLSSKSDMTRMDAAAGLAMVLAEVCDDLRVYTFSNETVAVPKRTGFALRDAILRSQPHGATYMGNAVAEANRAGYDRLIVISDEQTHDAVLSPKNARGYMINVGSYKMGVGYGDWKRINGFSEAVVAWIATVDGELA